MMRKKNYFFNLKIFKFFNQNDLNTLPRMFLSSFLIILTFYFVPILLEASKNRNFELPNNSKKILAYTLNNKGNGELTDEQILDENDLLSDILSLNDLDTDTVRLSASTIKQLFEDTNYSLDDVRKTKLVKPVALTLLPDEIKMERTLSNDSLVVKKLIKMGHKINSVRSMNRVDAILLKDGILYSGADRRGDDFAASF